MLVDLTNEQVNALRRVKEGMRHMDRYAPVPSDDSPVYVDADDCLHEFAFGDSGRLALGHLRDIASIELP